MRAETSPEIREDRLWRALACAADLSFVDLREHYVAASVRARLPAGLARARRWAPFIINERRIVLAVDDPFSALAFDPVELSQLFGPPRGRAIGFVLAAPSALEAFLERCYPTSAEA